MEELLQFIHTHTAEELQDALTPAVCRRINEEILQDPNEFLDFMFAKNIKIFGGINEYIHHFISHGTVGIIMNMPEGDVKEQSKVGAYIKLQKMLTYDITPETRTEVEAALEELQEMHEAAAAAGGGRRKGKSKRKARRFTSKRRV
jgi:hypothetical protein